MRALLALLLVLSPATLRADEFFTLKGHGGPIMAVATAEDGRIATASFDNSVGVWSNRAPEWLEGHEAAVNTVLFAGKAILSAGDDFSVRRWSSAGKVIGRHKGKVVGLAAANGWIASASWDGTIGLWSPETGQPDFLEGHGTGVNAVAFSRDGRRLYSAGMDGTLRLWSVADGKENRVLLRHGFGLNKILLGPDDAWLAYGAVDGVTRIVDPLSGDLLADFTLDRRPILALALSPDGRQLAVGDGEGYIMIVDTGIWRIRDDFRATLRGPVWTLAYTSDGRHLLAGGLDDALYAWPVEDLDEANRMSARNATFLRDPSKMDNGERQFMRKCSICHTLSPDSKRRAGPTLHGILGRPAGTVADYPYSDTLKGSSIIWSDDSINALFDEGPDNYIPGTKMPMQRIADPTDRADLIEFLRGSDPKEDME